MPSSYFSWLAEKKKRKRNRKYTTSVLPGVPSLQLFMPVFLELMQCESLWGGAHLVPIYTIYLWDSLALAQPAWALRPSLSLCCWLRATPSPPFTLPPSISARLPLYPADGTHPGSRAYKSFSLLLPSLLPPSRIEYLSRLGKSLISFPVSSVQSAPPPFLFQLNRLLLRA